MCVCVCVCERQKIYLKKEEERMEKGRKGKRKWGRNERGKEGRKM